MLIALMVILLVLIAVMAYLYYRLDLAYKRMHIRYSRLVMGLQTELAQSEKNYKALEQGRDEETEAYEQQYLSLYEELDAKTLAITSYIEDLNFLVPLARKHLDHCLPMVQENEAEARVQALEANLLPPSG